MANYRAMELKNVQDYIFFPFLESAEEDRFKKNHKFNKKGMFLGHLSISCIGEIIRNLKYSILNRKFYVFYRNSLIHKNAIFTWNAQDLVKPIQHHIQFEANWCILSFPCI